MQTSQTAGSILKARQLHLSPFRIFLLSSFQTWVSAYISEALSLADIATSTPNATQRRDSHIDLLLKSETSPNTHTKSSGRIPWQAIYGALKLPS